MKFVLKYLRELKTESILAPIFKMLEAVFELLVPLVVAQIIDKGIGTGDGGYVLRMCGVLIVLAVVGAASAITAQYFAAKAAIFSATRMRQDLYDHVMRFSEATMNHFGSSTLITRMSSDVLQVQNGINMFLRLFLRSPFIVAGAFVMSLFIDVRGAMVVLAVIGLLTLIVSVVMKTTLPGFAKVQQKLECLLLRTNENIEGVRVLRTFRQEEREKEGFHQEAAALYAQQIKVGAMSAVLSPLTYLIVNMGMILLLRDSSIKVDAGDLSQGQVVALTNYMSQILVELLKLANLILLLTRALSSVDRLREIMETPTDEREHKGAYGKQGTGAFEFRNVSFSYPSDAEHALQQVSVSVPKGETLGIIGGTGSGKSTLVRLLRHAFDATEGEVRLFGLDIKTYSDEDISKRIATVPQKAELFTGTIKSNLLMAKPNATEEEMWQAIEAAQAGDVVRGKEGMLDAKVERGGRNFSGGQRQRLTIARALLKKSDVLVLDDSASALDMATERRLRNAILELPWKPTVVFISQRASSIMDSDQILVLENGHVEGIGTHDALRQSCPVYEEIYRCQFPD